MAKIDVKAFGLAMGIFWGASLFLFGLTSTFFHWGTRMVSFCASFYYGYNASLVGSVIGAVWGLADGFICGALIAWLYNKFSK